MKRAAAAVLALGALIAGLVTRARAAASQAPQDAQDAPQGTSWADGWADAPLDLLPAQDLGSWISNALPDLTPVGAPPQAVSAAQEDRNVSAFLAMIRAAEGTAAPGGYGALFGWPAAGRSFDPLTIGGHPKIYFKYTDKAGKEISTSAAGAYQIVYSTWSSRRVPFLAWAAFSGLSTEGFLPATQDAFAMYLLNVRGALDDVRAGRFYSAIQKARAEWASLPGAGANQPERTESYVVSAYRAAGGVIA